MELDHVILLRRSVNWKEEEVQSIAYTNKSKESVNFESMMAYEPSNFRDLETFLETRPVEQDDYNFLQQK